MRERERVCKRVREGGRYFKHRNGFKNPKSITFEINLYEVLKCQ